MVQERVEKLRFNRFSSRGCNRFKVTIRIAHEGLVRLEALF